MPTMTELLVQMQEAFYVLRDDDVAKGGPQVIAAVDLAQQALSYIVPLATLGTNPQVAMPEDPDEPELLAHCWQRVQKAAQPEAPMGPSAQTDEPPAAEEGT